MRESSPMNQIFVRSHSNPAPTSTQTFFGQTMGYFALALTATAGGVFAGMFWLPPALISSGGFMLAMFAVTLILIFTARKWSVGRFGYLFLILFAGILGLTLVPILAYATLTAGVGILGKALLATVSMFGGMAIYGFTTKRDLSGIGGFLMAGLIGMICVSVITFIFHLFGVEVWSSRIELIFSGFGILLFAGFTAHDFQKITHAQPGISPISAAISLFLDFVLLFQYILRFMIAMNRD